MSNIQQTYALLQRMYELMQQIERQSEVTEKKIEKNVNAYKELKNIALQYLVVARQLGLPTQVDYFLQKVSMMILAVNQLIRTIELARIAYVGAGPIGWLALGASVAYTSLSFYSLGNQ